MSDLTRLLAEAAGLFAPDQVRRAVDEQSGLYYAAIYQAVLGYLASDGAVTAFRNAMGQTVIEGLSTAFYTGYLDAGGEERTQEDENWLTDFINAELAHVRQLFTTLRQLRGAVDPEAEAASRATGYSRTLRSVYAEGRARGDRNVMLTFRGEAGRQDPCRTCAKWNEKTHSAGFWISRGLIGRNGNDSYECGRWESCHHHFYLRDTGELYAE